MAVLEGYMNGKPPQPMSEAMSDGEDSETKMYQSQPDMILFKKAVTLPLCFRKQRPLTNGFAPILTDL